MWRQICLIDAVVYLQLFLILTLDESEWLLHILSALPAGRIASVPVRQEDDGLSIWPGFFGEDKISTPVGNWNLDIAALIPVTIPTVLFRLSSWIRTDKGEGQPRTGQEGPDGEQIYSSTLPSTSALGGVWVVDATPRPLYPQGRPGTHCVGGWVGPRTGLKGCGKSPPSPGFDPRSVQSVASLYTDWAIAAPC